MDNKTLEKKEVLRKKREKQKQEKNACFFSKVTKKKSRQKHCADHITLVKQYY